MDDSPVGRVADVERLLQLLALLRNGEGWVSHTKLRANVAAYRDSTATEDAVARMMQRDIAALRDLGFDIEGETHEGTPARYRLTPTAWRVPLALEPDEERLLAWVMAAAGAAPQDQAPPSLPALNGGAIGSLLGLPPRALDTVHTALSTRRRLVIRRDGQQREIEPAQLSVQQGRWFLIARYPGADGFYGFRLDRLEVVGLGDAMRDNVIPPDPLTVVDNTAWRKHAPVTVELRCAQEDDERIVAWFARATVTSDGDEVVMRLEVTNIEALIDRVLRFGGAVRVVSPPDVVAQLRERALAFAGDGEAS